MAEALRGDDRLPWLDAPRPASPARAASKARGPLIALLGLFLAGGIAVMAFLAGRSTAPPPEPLVTAILPPPAAPSQAPPPTAAPVPEPQAAPLIAPPAPAAVPLPPTPAPAVRATPPKPRPIPPKASVRQARPQRQARTIVAPAVDRPRPAPIVRAAPPLRAVWPARPFAGPRGRVIQLGAYRTQPLADAAWWRVARAYPYLATLPRSVSAVGPTPGRARYYRVRLAAGSNREARALCRNLRRVGRGCMIV